MPAERYASVVCLHGLGRAPSDWDGVRAGLAPYGDVHAPAIPKRPADAFECVDAAVGAGDIVVGHSIGGVLALRLALASALRLRRWTPQCWSCTRDDHHVPVNFALAAAAREPGWTVRILATGGHHAHVDRPEEWLAAVGPFLDLPELSRR